MPNIHNLTVVYDSTSSSTGSIPIDLNCGTPEVNKVITSGIYDLDFTPPKKVSNLIGSNTVFLTKIEGCDGSFVLVEEPVGEVSDLVISLCGVCQEVNGTKPVLGADCATPMNTKDCDRQELLDKFDEQLAELVKIYGAVDGLELTTENIRIEAGQINLNTDQVEQLLTDIKTLIDNATGKDCATATFTKDCDRQALLDKIGEVVTAINTTSANEVNVLNEISDKLDILVDIKGQLELANATLTGIKTDTSSINTQITDLLSKVDEQIALLTEIKNSASGNTTLLTDIKDLLGEINVNIGDILLDLGAIKTAVESIDATTKAISIKIDNVITILSEINDKLADVILGLTTINTTLQTEFDQTQAKLDELKAAAEFGQVLYQVQDCDGADVGTPQEANAVVVLNNVITKVCNVDELANAIATAINAGATPPIDYTALLTSIDTKLDTLEDIKTATESSLAELETANTTLNSIKTDTTAIATNTENTVTKLTELLVKIDAQLLLLGDIKALITSGNATLVEIKDKLTEIDTAIDAIATDIATIKTDIATIKADVSEIKTDVKTIIAKLDLVLTALSGITDLLTSIDDKLTETNSLLQSLLDELDIELVYTTSVKFNDGVNNYYSREVTLFDSETGLKVSSIFQKSTDGVTWQPYTPTGTENIGWITAEPYVEKDLILGESAEYCATATDGTKSQIFLRQNYIFNNKTEEKVLQPIEYSTDKIVWTTTATPNTTFTFGACPVEAIAPICIENVSYELIGAKGMVLEANKINDYCVMIDEGYAKLKEKNQISFREAGRSFSNGFDDDYKLLPNEVVIVNKDASSLTTINVLQVCGYVPIFADVIDETLLRLNSVESNANKTALLANLDKVKNSAGVETATEYVVKRYLKGANPSTAVTLSTLTVGTPNALFVDNGDTYTFTDSTAQPDTDYVYFYEASNLLSSGASNELEGRLLSTSFKPKFRTTTANELVTLPMTTTSPVVINWGDGTTTTQSAPFTHTYATAGDYVVEVKITASREVTNFRFANAGDKLKLIDIVNWGWAKFALGFNFQGCENLTVITAEDTPISLNNLQSFFRGCKKLTSITELDNWDTSLNTTMNATFFGCDLFNQEVKFNTDLVTNFAYCFAACYAFNKPVNFNTANATDVSAMFKDAYKFNQRLTFNTGKVTNMFQMFNNAWEFNSQLDFSDTSKVTNFASMFLTAKAFNQPVNFNTVSATNMADMFNQAFAFNQPINFNTANVTGMQYMFSQATAFNSSLNFSDTSKVTNMNYMFRSASAFNQPVPFNTTKVTGMQYMFISATSFNQQINFQIPLVANLTGFVNNATSFSTTNMDYVLNNFAGQTTLSNVPMTDNRPRTTASNTAVNTLISRGWTGLV